MLDLPYVKFEIIHFSCAFAGLTITNGPQDTVVCNNQLVDCTCGFVGADPNIAIPDWLIIKRNANGAAVSGEVTSGLDIAGDTNDGLEWIPDLANPSNSVAIKSWSSGWY